MSAGNGADLLRYGHRVAESQREAPQQTCLKEQTRVALGNAARNVHTCPVVIRQPELCASVVNITRSLSHASSDGLNPQEGRRSCACALPSPSARRLQPLEPSRRARREGSSEVKMVCVMNGLCCAVWSGLCLAERAVAAGRKKRAKNARAIRATNGQRRGRMGA